jgi:hypothetical protein
MTGWSYALQKKFLFTSGRAYGYALAPGGHTGPLLTVVILRTASQVGRASSPATLGGTGFQPVRITGKMPGATKNFSGQFLMGLKATHSDEKFVGRASRPLL